jgi:diguanylate cyclase (GGDEF)-like protein
MRPSRRVIALTVMAVLCGALLVGVALLRLTGPQDEISVLDQRVLPASDALFRAETGLRRTQALFKEALASPPEERGTIIAESQATGNRAASAWRDYRGIAYDSPAERRLQRSYDESTTAGQAAGATAFGLVDSPDTAAFEAALAFEEEISTKNLATVNTINERFYASRVRRSLHTTSTSLDATWIWILLAFALVLVVGLLNAAIHLRGAFRDERLLAKSQADRGREQHRSDLETQLQRGLEMEPTEEATYAVIGEALDLVLPERPVELLVADSSRAHFRQVLSTDPDGQKPGCPVTSPSDCPAASTGQTRLFPSSARLDACPFLRSRDEPSQSATCIPISIAGTNTGMIHTTGPDGEPANPDEVVELELVARKAGDRIGFLRVLARTETQARVDVLTGLFNRRSLEQQGDEVLGRGDPFVVGFADLDHFKDLNDKHGHEVGDRALRLFGRVLRDSVRPADIPARYGGEEFVVLLPDCSLSDARIVADRVRSRLTAALGAATVPAFTVSFGLAAWEPSEPLADTIARADGALLDAKEAGRDRVLTAARLPDPEPTAAPRPSRTTEPEPQPEPEPVDQS